MTADFANILAMLAGLKARDPDMLLLFGIGDGYRAYGPDAERVAALLGLPLAPGGDGPPTADVPGDGIEAALAAVVAAGWRAALLERATPPSLDVSRGAVTGLRDGMVVVPGTPVEAPGVRAQPARRKRKAGAVQTPQGRKETLPRPRSIESASDGADASQRTLGLSSNVRQKTLFGD